MKNSHDFYFSNKIHYWLELLKDKYWKLRTQVQKEIAHKYQIAH